MSIKKSLAWMGLAQVATFIFQFGSSIVLARYLTPAEMGVFAVGLATIAMLALFQTFGFQPLIVREKKLTPALQATVFTANAVSCICQTATTFLFAIVGASFLRDEGVKHVLQILAITPLFGILSFMPGAMLERNGRFKEVAIIGACTSLVGSGATIIFAVLGYKYMSLAYANVIASLALSCSLIIVGWKYQMFRVDLSQWRHVFHFGFQMFAYSGVVSFSQRLSEIMLGRIAGLGMLGLYNRASGMNNMLWGNIHHLVSRVMLVDFAKHHGSPETLRERYLKSAAVMTAVLWPAFAGLAVLSHPFIYLVYGAKWMPAAVPLIYLTIASMILVAMTLSWELFAATGNVASQTRIEIVRTSISTPLFIAACFVNIETVAFTRIVDAILAYALYRPHLQKMSGTKLRDFTGVYSKGALLTIAAILPASLMMLFSKFDHPQFGMVILAVFSGIALWGLALSQLDHPLKDELLAVWRRIGRFSPQEESVE